MHDNDNILAILCAPLLNPPKIESNNYNDWKEPVVLPVADPDPV